MASIQLSLVKSNRFSVGSLVPANVKLEAAPYEITVPPNTKAAITSISYAVLNTSLLCITKIQHTALDLSDAQTLIVFDPAPPAAGFQTAIEADGFPVLPIVEGGTEGRKIIVWWDNSQLGGTAVSNCLVTGEYIF